jgi:Protein of unknown function (DUF4238)
VARFISTAMVTTSNVRNKKSEYHHFVPQFILRKYSDYIKPFPEPGLEKQQLDRKISKAKAKARASIIDLNTHRVNIEQSRTNYIFGEQDMYISVDTLTSDKFGIEKRLSALEQKAPKIIKRIEEDHSKGLLSTRICQADKDELRRVLFITLYRKRGLHGKYDRSTEESQAVDQDEIQGYYPIRFFRSEVPSG